MMILLTNIFMIALLMVTGALWSEYRRDQIMAKHRRQIEAIEKTDYERKYCSVCKPDGMKRHCA